ncbi:DUF305 domain-containing protein [Brevundimonas bullata]|jgi:uncharacterized protein (DUF305 family)|uniref:DUF305 domain-containing protein n=1 Tax=Brevundimonas bullata TaxID=13160 RepID=UPI001B86D6A4|nr:DUF305 domain-containing protein [Brevundimonas bullata]WQE37968.1 DUF305 domain-containing protein [Brevundimonas bullata]
MSIKLKAALAGVALSGLLMACTPAENTETAPAAPTETAGATPNAGGMGAEAMAGPQTPYTASEQQMHQAMMQAHGADPQETFALKMIEHHRGAIAMSEVLMQQNPDPELRQMAEKTMTMQRQEITELEQWVTRHRAGSAAPAPGAAQPAG